jgi:protein O-GlcNAc transferase
MREFELKVWRLHPRGVRVVPAEKTLGGAAAPMGVKWCGPFTNANKYGFWLFPPLDVDVIWRGGMDFECRVLDPWPDDEVPFVRSLRREDDSDERKLILDAFAGKNKLILAVPDFHAFRLWTGCVFQTPPGWGLLVRSPINLGMNAPYRIQEGIIETDWLFVDFWLGIAIQQKGALVRLRRDQWPPLAQLVPVPREAYDRTWQCSEELLHRHTEEAERVFTGWVDYHFEKYGRKQEVMNQDRGTYFRERARHLGKRTPAPEAPPATGPGVAGAGLGLLGGDALAVAERLYRSGALRQAEQLYRQVVGQQPDNGEAWSRLGEVCHSLRRPREALPGYFRALELEPASARTHNNLGLALMDLREFARAAASFEAALRLQPDFVEAHRNLGLAHLKQGQLDQATACFREALRLQPADPAALNNLGHVLVRQGQVQEALPCFARAVQGQADFDRAWLGLGDALHRLGRLEEAGASFQKAAQLRPDDPEPLAALGTLLMDLGRPADAAHCYQRLLRLRPDAAGVCNNLGLALLNAGRTDEAVLSFRQALYLEPKLVEAHNNLGLALAARGDADGALECCERAVAIQPDHAGALVNLGNACKDQGRLTEAIACYRKAVEVQPANAALHSNLLLAMQYLAGIDPQEILAEARRFAQRHAEPLTAAAAPHGVRPLPGRRLRIGYVSADFREHPVAYFLEPILSSHDRTRFEVFCYADVRQPDAVSQRLRGYADQWRSLVGLSDAQAADLIRQDGIDVLVDLSGHTGGNRLLAFARKPAPVQASYLGYLGTTGLPAMDYNVTDTCADPPGLTEGHYQEQLVRLPECAFCYRPGPTPEVNAELPARQSGRVTFACLNAPAKLAEEVLALWSRILAAVPGSRLLLRTGVGRRAEERVRDALARGGLSPEQVSFAGRTASRLDYLKLYQAVDLCLDPFPYNGVTTTCDALWMGVPVLGLAGDRSAARMGVRFLRNVGLEELIAQMPESYVRLAVELAGDLDRLAALRCGLRERMSRSPLMDAQGCAHRLETAYREMWDRWAART